VANEHYIERLKQVIFHLHKADSRHLESVPVEEVFQGQTVWRGVVEVFALVGHPKALRAYAWSLRDGQDDSDERFVAVLELPPVTSPQMAVKVAVASEIKSKKLDRKPRR
jgi:hypothetical protein